jgi:hypothetical protein
MTALSIEVVRDELFSLIRESIEEFQKAEAQVGVSLLLEAQFLLGEVIQHKLKKIHCAPSLSLVTREWAQDGDQAILTAAS